MTYQPSKVCLLQVTRTKEIAIATLKPVIAQFVLTIQLS